MIWLYHYLRTVTAMPVPDTLKKHSLSAATAVLFGVAFWRLGLSPVLPAVLAFIFGGVLLAVIDWKVYRLPKRLVYYTLAGVAGGLALAALVEWNWRPLATAALGGVLFANALMFLRLMTRNAGMSLIGFGDVRLAVVLGLLLGWYGLNYVIYGAIAGHLLALLVAIVMSVRQRKLVLHYPFGPSLIAGTLAVVLIHA